VHGKTEVVKYKRKRLLKIQCLKSGMEREDNFVRTFIKP
jgi:hypothetical protein